MELSVISLDGKEGGKVTLNDEIFGLEVRQDLLHRAVNWQLNKRRAGTHKVKNRAEIWRTGKKMYGQKGTGNARHGSARVPQFRGGGRAFGPVVRSHETELPKKLRQLALKHALSAKAKNASIVVLADATMSEPKTKMLAQNLKNLGLGSVLVIGGAEIEKNFGLAARNLHEVDVLPVQGINVYDIMRRQKLVLTKAALDALEARFK
ncbi:MAG TPA: 50S ribosomal protein L4 [Xanthobacteraceae bacterium]|nr:50S ribosomal protein L4 [Xanthobacteraceae bacterium]